LTGEQCDGRRRIATGWKRRKITRVGCGALLGFFVGLYLIGKWLIVSVGAAVAVWAGAILACGYLALKYGDEFWHGMFGRKP
jgi:hypothetical protein